MAQTALAAAGGPVKWAILEKGAANVLPCEEDVARVDILRE